MTTAEMIFAQPGDTLLDRKQEFRKVFWAFVAALFIHLARAAALVWTEMATFKSAGVSTGS